MKMSPSKPDGVAQQLARGDLRGRVLVDDPELRQVRADRGVEVDLALVDQLHHERARPELGDRPDLEHRVRRWPPRRWPCSARRRRRRRPRRRRGRPRPRPGRRTSRSAWAAGRRSRSSPRAGRSWCHTVRTSPCRCVRRSTQETPPGSVRSHEPLSMGFSSSVAQAVAEGEQLARAVRTRDRDRQPADRIHLAEEHPHQRLDLVGGVADRCRARSAPRGTTRRRTGCASRRRRPASRSPAGPGPAWSAPRRPRSAGRCSRRRRRRCWSRPPRGRQPAPTRPRRRSRSTIGVVPDSRTCVVAPRAASAAAIAWVVPTPQPATSTLRGPDASGSSPTSFLTSVVVRSVIACASARCCGAPMTCGAAAGSTNGSLEQPTAELVQQDPVDGLVEPLAADLAAADRVEHRAVGRGHLRRDEQLVGSGEHRLDRGHVRRIRGRGARHVKRVGDDQSVEPELVAQQAGEDLVRHRRRHPGVDRGHHT